MTTEEVFPRGGKKSKLCVDKSNHISGKDFDDDLFRTIKHKRPKKKSKKSKEDSTNDEPDLNEEIVSVENLSPKTLLNNMVVFGCLRDVSDFGLSVSLPGGQTAKVPVTNISDDYTSLLQKYVQNPLAMQEDLATLSSQYLVGSCYPVRVMSHDIDTSTSKFSTVLSINPKDVNRDISPSSVYHGMLLPASVQSVEDHGCVMSLGLGNLQGFLSASNFPQGSQLSVGQVVLCSVDMPQLIQTTEVMGRVLTLTAKPKSFDKPLNLDETKAGLHAILPGTVLKAIIIEIKKNGLVVKCSEFSGCVYRDHLKNVFDTPNKYKMGDEVVGTVLYQQPITNTLHLTLSPKITPRNIKSLFQGLKYGEFIDEAPVIKATRSMVYFQISDKIKGVARFRHLSNNDVNMDIASEHFQLGDKHRCRILGFNFMDKVVLVSLRKDIQLQVQIDKNDLQVGKIFPGVVDHTVEHGIIVKLGHRSFGLVPRMHMTDIKTENPERLLPPGTKVQCRILRLDLLGNYVKPLLTCKRSLVNSSISPLSSYEDAKVGDEYQGVVIQTNQGGVLLSFYNNIKGWVPIRELSTEFIEYPEKLFYIGQVVKARVTKCTPEEKRLYLSLKIETRKPFGLKKMAEGMNLETGTLVSVKITKKSAKGLDLEILPTGLEAFMPIHHLSDQPWLGQLFFDLYEIGDTLDQVLCFITKGNIIVSKKRSFIQCASSGNFIHTLSDVKPGTLVPSVIKSFMNYGIFLEIGSGISGLVHKTNIRDGPSDLPSSLGFVTHQTLIARVLNVHADSNKIDLSTRLTDVSEDTVTDQVRLLDNFLRDWKEIATLNVQKDKFKDVATIKVGSILTVTVDSISSEEMVCHTESGVSGIIAKQNIGDLEPEVDESYEGVVLYLDLESNRLELSTCPKLVQRYKAFKKSGKIKLDHLLGKSVPCTVLLSQTNFALAALQDLSEGFLTYLPVFKHPNDLSYIPYIIGGTINVTIHKVCKRFVIGTKSIEIKSSTKRSISSKNNKSNPKKIKLDRQTVTSGVSTTSRLDNNNNNSKTETTAGIEKEEPKSEFQLGDVIEGTICNFSPARIYVQLAHKIIGSLKRPRSAGDLAKGTSLLVRVINIANEHIILTRAKNVQGSQLAKKLKKEDLENQEVNIKETIAHVKLSSYQVPIVSNAKTPVVKRLQVSGGLKWDVEATPNLSKLDQQKMLGASQQDNSSDSESESEKTKTRSGAKDKKKKQKLEEEYLNKQELRLMDSNREPETVEDFDRLVLSQPDNSVVWLKYITFHLQQAEVDKARAVAQRALSTISFREEQEKLNVWFALLNLENLYGTSESLESTFQKAVQMNDPFKVYSHMADVYAQEGKHEEAEKLYATMLKKFKGEPQPWLNFAKLCLKTGKNQKAHDLFQKALNSLDKKHHVDVVTKFAQQEFKHGEVERGKTMFESILNSYPKRVDLWSQYADLLLKKGDVEGTRQVMERSIGSNLSAKKMKYLFKKYLDFEKQHGTDELVEKLKAKALEYVHSTSDA